MVRLHQWVDTFADKLEWRPGIAPERQDFYNDDAIREYSTLRLNQLKTHPITGNWDLEHLAKIHAFLFQDVSSVAGSVRDYEMIKGETTFPDYNKIQKIFDTDIPIIKSHIEKNKDDPDKFASEVATLYNSLNIAHPFREGNGRTIREFLSGFVQEYGYSINLHATASKDKDHWNEISEVAALHGFMDPLTNVFKDAMVTKKVASTLELFDALLDQRFPKDTQKKEKYHRAVRITLKQLSDEQLTEFANDVSKMLNKPFQPSLDFNSKPKESKVHNSKSKDDYDLEL